MFAIAENSQSAFAEFLSENGIDRYRAKQVFYWIYKKSKLDFSDFTNLPKPVIDFLKHKCGILTAETVKHTVSKSDNTKKFLIKLKDSSLIESALLYSDAERYTACLSTQAGCAVCCVFCASGKSGFKRNLSVSEIISQYLLMRREALAGKNDVTNIVFMGIGEPFLNYDNVMSAVEILTDPLAGNIGARHITVSTSGVAPMIDSLAGYKKQIKLSISLHSAFDKKRDMLVPLNRKYNLEALLKAVKRYTCKTSRPVTFEYVLIKGLNDTKEDVVELSRILKNLQCKVNLIPYNSIDGLDFKPPDNSDVEKFANSLVKNRIKVIRRQRKGFDINSGCGQLKASWIGQ